MFGASSELASVMEFGFDPATANMIFNMTSLAQIQKQAIGELFTVTREMAPRARTLFSTIAYYVQKTSRIFINSSNQAQSQYKHVLANISRSRYVATATQPMHRLQIRPIVHN